MQLLRIPGFTSMVSAIRFLLSGFLWLAFCCEISSIQALLFVCLLCPMNAFACWLLLLTDTWAFLLILGFMHLTWSKRASFAWIMQCALWLIVSWLVCIRPRILDRFLWYACDPFRNKPIRRRRRRPPVNTDIKSYHETQSSTRLDHNHTIGHHRLLYTGVKSISMGSKSSWFLHESPIRKSNIIAKLRIWSSLVTQRTENREHYKRTKTHKRIILSSMAKEGQDHAHTDYSRAAAILECPIQCVNR